MRIISVSRKAAASWVTSVSRARFVVIVPMGLYATYYDLVES